MVLALVGAAWACPVCGAPGASNEAAYVSMTAMLSLLPLAFIGGVAYWVYRTATSSDGER
jgi:hypothetical protein